MADRGALLKQIQQGKRLKKSVTNDRSKPQVGASGGGGSGGGGGPPMGGMALPRPPIPPPSGGGRSSTSGGAAAAPPPPAGPPAGMPGLGGLFAGGMPTLKHRSGGVSTGRGEKGGSPSNGSAPTSAPPPPPPATQKSPTKSKFSFSFGRSSHARSSSSSNSNGAPPPPAAAPPPPPPTARAPPPPSNGPPALPGRRLSDIGAPAFAPPVPPAGRLPGVPPASAPATRPGSAVSGKRAPPPPPTSRKPQTKPKPPGLMSNRHSSTSPSPSPSSVPSTADLRSTLRPAAATTQNTPRASAIMQPRNSQDDGTDSGIIAESQGSVSSLAGIFGKSVRSKGANHSRSLTETMFNRTESPPAPARPPVPPSAAFGDRFSHQRTGSGSAPPHPPPPPPPQSAGAGANGTASVPVREGKWSFHSMSDLPQPPQMSISRHKYPSGNATGSAIALDI